MIDEIKKYLNQVANKVSLSESEASDAFDIIMNGGATPAQIAAFITALKMKGENIDEVVAIAKIMRNKALYFPCIHGAIDTCGTGGDNKGSLNISTAVAFVVAACGVPVAKHGNKSISSQSGSADVLRLLGVNIEAKPEIMAKALKEKGICFLLAPIYHPMMNHVAVIRSQLGLRTIFNILGPLLNPANVKRQVVGVYDKDLMPLVAGVFLKLNAEKIWVVHSSDGMDELSISAPTYVTELDNGKISQFVVSPDDAGLNTHDLKLIKGGDAKFNANKMRQLFDGQETGAYFDIVIFNTAAALLVAGKVNSLQEGAVMAKNVIENGSVSTKLQELVVVTNS